MTADISKKAASVHVFIKHIESSDLMQIIRDKGTCYCTEFESDSWNYR